MLRAFFIFVIWVLEFSEPKARLVSLLRATFSKTMPNEPIKVFCSEMIDSLSLWPQTTLASLLSLVTTLELLVSLVESLLR